MIALLRLGRIAAHPQVADRIMLAVALAAVAATAVAHALRLA